MRYRLFIVLFLSGEVLSAQTIPQKLIDSHIEKLTNAKAYTLAVARLMPAALYRFKPVENEMSFGEQLIHISQNLYWLSSTYIAEIAHPPAASKDDLLLPDKDSIIARVEKAYAYTIESIAKLDTGSLSRELPFFAGNKNKYQILNLIEDHQTHHRAQLLVYLRLNGIKPPSYIGW